MKSSACETEAIFAELQKIMKLLPRKQQLELACHIEYCLRDLKHLIAEAPTGVGKTIAYLIPAILLSLKTKKKVIISTSSKTLQKQLVDVDLPNLQKILPFEFLLSLGSDNYICDSRMSQGHQLGFFGNSDDIDALEKIAVLRRKNPEATFLDCEFSVPDSLKKRIRRDSHACSSKCQLKESCTYMMTAKKYRDAHILVTNHHKTLHLLKNSSRKLDDTEAIIFDECHNLEDSATIVFSNDISGKDVITAIKELYDQRSEGGLLGRVRASRELKDAAIIAVRSVTERIYELHETAIHTLKDTGQDLANEDLECLKQLQSSLIHLSSILQKSKVDLLMQYSAQLDDFVKIIDCILKKEKGYVHWKHVTKHSWTFTATPLSVSDILRKKLFRANKITTVHVSATVALKKNMGFYRSRIGIINAEEKIVESPFNYRKQAAIYIPSTMPEPLEKGYVPAAIAEIEKLITHFQGRTLILFTSYAAMNEAHELLCKQCPDFVFLKQGDSATNSLINKFKKTDKGVLLGAATFWEGVDIPGPALQCVIIMKLPFGVPTDPVAMAHQEELKKRGLQPFWSYLLPPALIKFRQGFGRLIRRENDSGVVAILDARIRTKLYGKTFRKSLPDCPVIRDICGFPVKKRN